MRGALACASALLLSGCTDLAGNETGAPPDAVPAPPEPATRWQLATWNQSGVFEALPADGTRAGFQFEAEGLGDGLPMTGVTAPFDDLALREIRWQAQPDAVHFGTIVLDETGRVSLFLVGDAHQEARELFVSWAENVTGANETALGAWADAFVASESPRSTLTTLEGTVETVHAFATFVPGPFRVPSLVEELGATRTDDGYVDVRYEAPNWTFELVVPSKAASRVPEPETSQGTTLGATARGLVLVERWGPDLASDDEFQDLTRDIFHELDLGEPTFEGFRASEFFPD